MHFNLPKIIGISGKLGSGKDTVGLMINSIMPQYKLFSFADNVKKITSIITSTPIELQYSRAGKKTVINSSKNLTISNYQQLIGEGLRNIIDENIWIDSVLSNPEPYKIITDVRYKNEAYKIIENNGIIIRIEKDFIDIEDGRDKNHISECDLDDFKFEYILNNNSSMEELENNLKIILGKFVAINGLKTKISP
jgi:hypothetical protein